jgi:hypothetical protein
MHMEIRSKTQFPSAFRLLPGAVLDDLNMRHNTMCDNQKYRSMEQ